MAIPVFLRDTFYLVENATSEEIFNILKEEGINSSTLRGKATMQFPAASFDAIKPVIKTSLSEANMAFYQVGDSFLPMPITDVEHLGYYKANDGRVFTSVQDYHMTTLSEKATLPKAEQIPSPFVKENVSNGIPSPFVEDSVAKQIHNPFAGEVVLDEIRHPFAEKKRGVSELIALPASSMVDPMKKNTPAISGASVAEMVVVDEDVADVTDEPQYREEYTEDQTNFLDNAGFLDSVLSNGTYHKISDHLQFALGDVERLLAAVGEDYEQHIKIPTLEAAAMLDYVTGTLPNGVFKNAVGESAKLIDAMIMLPVFSALLGKRNKSLQKKFSVANLVDSKFARISVAGISQSGALCGFVHFETITNEAVAAAKEKVEEYLSSEGKKFNDLTSQEKYELYLKEISAYFVAHKDCGKMLAAPNSGKYVDLSRALAEMEKQKFSVPEFYNQEESMITWPSYETISFDNRGEKSLEEQAKEIIKPTRVLVEKTVESSPVIKKNTGPVSMEVISLPSSFEDTDDIVTLEGQNSGLTDAEVDDLLRVLVREPAKPKTDIRRIGPGETLIDGSVGISVLPSLMNPIAYIDGKGHQWESKAAYDAAMKLIGLPGNLLDSSPLELGEGDNVVVKGK